MRRPSFLALLSVPLVAACATSAVERSAPYELDLTHRPGGVLSGPVVAEREGQQGPWAVELRLERFDELHATGPPLAARVRRALVVADGAPLRTRSELALGVETLVEPPRGEPTWTATELAFVWPGTTVAWDAEPVHDAARTPWRRFGVELARAADPERVEMAVWFEGLVVPRVEEGDLLDAEPVTTPAPERRRERLVLDPSDAPDGVALRLLLPSPRPLLPYAAEVLTVSVRRDPDLTDAEAAIARADEGFQDELERARIAPPEAERSLRRERAGAVEALARRSPHREALLFLADATDAALAVDVALVATDAALAAYQEALRPTLEGAEASAADTQRFGWLLERETWRWLAARTSDEDRGEEHELRALLLRRAGEVGSVPDALLDALAACDDATALEERLVAENRVLLEDGRPAARVRAYDWLALRGLAPEGFDPLASRDARRAALKALEDAERTSEEDDR